MIELIIKMKSMTLKPEIDELNNLNQFILNEIPEKNLQIKFIVEEIFANIVNYSKTEFITVNVEFKESQIILEFIDNGIEFNPLLKKDYIKPETIDEAQIGGLGIFLTKQIADELYYSYINGENHLKIIKSVK